MAAASLKVKELALSEAEAKLLAARTANVAQYYDMRVSEKAQAWLALIFVAGQIYYPRVMAVAKASKAAKNPVAAQALQ